MESVKWWGSLLMWSYYGNKSKLVNLYPEPTTDTVIEPFAGTARYALKYWDKNIILRDTSEVIIGIWKYLQQATEKDIEALPELENKGDKLPEYLCQEEKWLLGFAMNRGSSQPKKSYSGWAARDKEITRHKNRIIRDLHKIKHWDIQQGSYDSIGNQEATWFIDPPYEKEGKYYKDPSKCIDYEKLGNYCKDRLGQVIVCETATATWLPFTPMVKSRGRIKQEMTIEAIWLKP